MLRRRKEKKTDYRIRLALLKSRKPRIVVRRSNYLISVQLVEYEKQGDKTLCETSSKALRPYGWKASLTNTSAGYLTGLLAGKLFLEHGKEGVLDMGLRISTKGNVTYAVLKGLLDAGFAIPHNEKNIPSEERIKGLAVANYMKKNEKRFSGYVKKKLKPEDIPKMFEDVKNKIGEESGKRKTKRKK